MLGVLPGLISNVIYVFNSTPGNACTKNKNELLINKFRTIFNNKKT